VPAPGDRRPLPVFGKEGVQGTDMRPLFIGSQNSRISNKWSMGLWYASPATYSAKGGWSAEPKFFNKGVSWGNEDPFDFKSWRLRMYYSASLTARERAQYSVESYSVIVKNRVDFRSSVVWFAAETFWEVCHYVYFRITLAETGKWSGATERAPLHCLPCKLRIMGTLSSFLVVKIEY